MKKDQWWQKPKDLEDKYIDTVKREVFRSDRRAAAEIVAAANNSQTSEQQRRAQQQSREYWDKKTQADIENKLKLDALKAKEVQARADGPNRLGFFTDQSYTRDQFTLKDRLEIRKQEARDKADRTVVTPPEQRSRFDWAEDARRKADAAQPMRYYPKPKDQDPDR